jgi:hypothetical protein
VNNGQLASVISFTRNDDFSISADIDGEVIVCSQSFKSEYHTFLDIKKILARCCKSAVLQCELTAAAIDGFNVTMLPKDAGQTKEASVQLLVEFLEDAMSSVMPKAPVFVEDNACGENAPLFNGETGPLLSQPFEVEGFCCERNNGVPYFNIEQLVYGGQNAPRMDWVGPECQTLALSSNVISRYADMSGIPIRREHSYRICSQFVDEVISTLSRDGGVISLLAIDNFLMKTIDC